MAWVATESLSFTARHDEADAAAAHDLLEDLETFRAELAELFPKTPGDIAVIVHPGTLGLSLAQPWLPLARRAASPASRRYMAGWFSRSEIHVLSPEALDDRASPGEGSREALMLSPLHEYAHLAIGANNEALPPPFNPRSFLRYLRWAWLAEGAAAELSGQTPHLRAAVARRLHEGSPPAFPPSARDAPLLGGTLLGMLSEEAGPRAVAKLASRLHPHGAERAIEEAFGRRLMEIEADWRARLAGATGRSSGRRRRHLYGIEGEGAS
ncbi:MAG: hypothetical protein QOG63_1643 [Thermoleophilaceae bacterium]|nr:hypothetical protein [Thermoleophilaceae bacterium]